MAYFPVNFDSEDVEKIQAEPIEVSNTQEAENE